MMERVSLSPLRRTPTADPKESRREAIMIMARSFPLLGLTTLDSEVIGSPLRDLLLDISGRLELTSGAAASELGRFVIRREAKSHQLPRRERSDRGVLVRWHQALKAQALFKTDHASLNSQRHQSGHQRESDERARDSHHPD